MPFHPGMKIRMARQMDGLTQQDLADALAARTGEDWTREVIANIETGRKKLTPDILMPVAYEQNRPLEFYLVAPGERVPGTNLVIPGQLKYRTHKPIMPDILAESADLPIPA